MYQYKRLLADANIMTKVTLIFLCSIFMLFVCCGMSLALDKIVDTQYKTYVFQSVMACMVFLLPALALSFFFHKQEESSLSYLSVDKMPRPVLLGLGLVSILSAIPLVNGTAELNKMVVPEDEAAAAKLVELLTSGGLSFFFLRILVVAFLTAVTEEMFFRGLLQNTLVRYMGCIPAVCISSLIFSLAHNDLSGVLPRFLLGCFLGFLLVRSGSLWLSVFVHFVHNGVIVTCYYFFFDKASCDCFIDRWGSDSVLWPLVSAVVVAGCVSLIYRNTRRS